MARPQTPPSGFENNKIFIQKMGAYVICVCVYVALLMELPTQKTQKIDSMGGAHIAPGPEAYPDN